MCSRDELVLARPRTSSSVQRPGPLAALEVTLDAPDRRGRALRRRPLSASSTRSILARPDRALDSERGAHRARHRDARRPRLHALATRRSGATPTPRCTATRSTTSPASSRRSASTSSRIRSARSSRATGRAASRCSAIGSHCDSNRNGGKYDGTMGVVTALEVCRLNEELGLDLPLQLISFLEEEGSGFGQMLLGSRIIAQRVDRGGAARAVPRDRRRPQLLGARGGGRLRARALARVRRTCSTTSPAGSRCTSSRRACSRTPATASASSRRSPATSTPTSSSTAAATTPARRRWTSASTRRSRSPRRSSSSSGSPREAGRGHGRDGRRDRGRPGAHQRDRRAASASRSTSAGPTTTPTAASPATSPRSPRRPRDRRGMRAEYHERQTLPATPMDERIVGGARGGREGDRRAVHADALGRGARHDVRRRPGADARWSSSRARTGSATTPAEDADPRTRRSRPRSS